MKLFIGKIIINFNEIKKINYEKNIYTIDINWDDFTIM